MLKEIKQYTTMDKLELFGDGPWIGEPDKVQFLHEPTGYDALIVRTQMGNLCGYVGVPKGHPAFKKGYYDVNVSVHGGLTFAGFCQPDRTENTGICHVALPGRSDKVWWLGFNCAYAWDLIPQMEKMRSMPGYPFKNNGREDTYRDMDYVMNQITSLAYQLQTMARPLNIVKSAVKSYWEKFSKSKS